MAGITKKGQVFVPAAYTGILDTLSKAALMDIAWNLALLQSGHESESEAFAILAHEADIVARNRGDRIDKRLADAADDERKRMIHREGGR